ncbi:MBL fold metallo-hydrolase [Jiangella alkaliphila]|uniref:L-ascorbate metabolism protein UlaG, beta-lactamase superfamily n=1 Tax=Jiangella alkaliphila TaxID=419479 RepID=A0A1H2KX20_9ACTN|nr:MBL fold metallo-hydrolase [Jiangella alkaliphila]SDU73270.1 L-ascorbate metabolism protein UlaG, beta-lactamase superfamily [Jiangella alkaliphila]
MILTHIGGPTVLVELDGWRLLTDPTFDPPGERYSFGWGTSSVKLTGPSVAPDEVGAVDVVLLTHDRHADNLDRLGRSILASAGTVVTTASGARRLGGGSVRGLAAGASTVLPGGDVRPDLSVTATPARHGPPLSRPIAGDVIGFALRLGDAPAVALWITGDTVLYGPLRSTATSLPVDVALVHVGGVRFGLTGPIRYTMTGRDAVTLIGLTRPRVAVPVHYEGWSHFADGPSGLDAALAAAPDDVRARVRRLDPGVPTSVDD